MIKRSTFRLRLCVTLLVLNLLFIWGNSLLPGELSAAFSQWVKALLGLGGDSQTGHGLLRKIAHFTEFACLGFLLTWLHSMLRKRRFFAVLYGMAAACMDETIQLFVPDRGPAVRDVLIDTAGVCVGAAVLCLYLFFKKRKIKETVQ